MASANGPSMPNPRDNHSTADPAVDFTRRPVYWPKDTFVPEQHPPTGRPAHIRAPWTDLEHSRTDPALLKTFAWAMGRPTAQVARPSAAVTSTSASPATRHRFAVTLQNPHVLPTFFNGKEHCFACGKRQLSFSLNLSVIFSKASSTVSRATRER